MPVQPQSEARARGQSRGWFVFAGVLFALAAVPLALYFFPAPIRLGSVMVLGPYSCSRLDFIFACGPQPDPNPAHVHVLEIVHHGRRSPRFWAREFQPRPPFLVLLGVDYPRQLRSDAR